MNPHEHNNIPFVDVDPIKCSRYQNLQGIKIRKELGNLDLTNSVYNFAKKINEVTIVIQRDISLKFEEVAGLLTNSLVVFCMGSKEIVGSTKIICEENTETYTCIGIGFVTKVDSDSFSYVSKEEYAGANTLILANPQIQSSLLATLTTHHEWIPRDKIVGNMCKYSFGLSHRAPIS